VSGSKAARMLEISFFRRIGGSVEGDARLG
jgi:hypothetical protein